MIKVEKIVNQETDICPPEQLNKIKKRLKELKDESVKSGLILIAYAVSVLSLFVFIFFTKYSVMEKLSLICIISFLIFIFGYSYIKNEYDIIKKYILIEDIVYKTLNANDRETILNGIVQLAGFKDYKEYLRSESYVYDARIDVEICELFHWKFKKCYISGNGRKIYDDVSNTLLTSLEEIIRKEKIEIDNRFCKYMKNNFEEKR